MRGNNSAGAGPGRGALLRGRRPRRPRSPEEAPPPRGVPGLPGFPGGAVAVSVRGVPGGDIIVLTLKPAARGPGDRDPPRQVPPRPATPRNPFTR